MRIAVLVKQVPNTTEVRIDPKTGNLIREGVESIINPEDRHGIEAAVALKERVDAERLGAATNDRVGLGRLASSPMAGRDGFRQIGSAGDRCGRTATSSCDETGSDAKSSFVEKNSNHGSTEVTVLSMGPPQAVEVICEALAMGADRGILLTDKAFSGADTWATSTALGMAIRKLGDIDLIIAGRQAVDGDTAQIGPQVAEFLGIPQITCVRRLEAKEHTLIAERVIENGCEHLEAPFPVLVTVLTALNEPRYPTVDRIVQATSEHADIEVWNAADIGAKALNVGLPGSLTQVVRTFTPKEARTTQYLEGSPATVAQRVIDYFRERDIRLGA